MTSACASGVSGWLSGMSVSLKAATGSGATSGQSCGARGRLSVRTRLTSAASRTSRATPSRLKVKSVDQQPGRARGVKERTVSKGLRRHVGEPVVEGRETAGKRGQDRHLLGCVAGHDLAVLVKGRLPTHLGGERADVVGHEAIIRGNWLGSAGELYGATICSAGTPRLRSGSMWPNNCVLMCGYSSPGSG
jgi:hypothetical protein